MTNSKIKEMLFKTGVKYYRLAQLMGISESTLYRKLREEFSKEERDKVIGLIKEEASHGE